MSSNSGNLKKSSILYVYWLILLHFDGDRTSGLNGTSVKCRQHEEKSRRAHESVESQGNINAFHFSLMSLQLGFSGWPGCLGLWGRWGSDSSIQQSLTHTVRHTPGARPNSMYSRWHISTYMYILKIPWHLTKTRRQRMCRESLALRNVHSPSRSAVKMRHFWGWGQTWQAGGAGADRQYRDPQLPTARAPHGPGRVTPLTVGSWGRRAGSRGWDPGCRRRWAPRRSPGAWCAVHPARCWRSASAPAGWRAGSLSGTCPVRSAASGSVRPSDPTPAPAHRWEHPAASAPRSSPGAHTVNPAGCPCSSGLPGAPSCRCSASWGFLPSRINFP